MSVSERYYQRSQDNFSGPRGPGGSFWGSLKARLTPTVAWLLIINVAVFIFQMLSYRFQSVHNGFDEIFSLSRATLLQGHVWQLVTYAFMHSVYSLFHIIFNMLLLFWMGLEVEKMMGAKRFICLYFLCTFVAGVAHVVITPYGVIGASGAVMGVMAAMAYFYPTATVRLMFIIPIQMRHLVWLLAGVDILVGLSGVESRVAVFAHLGGLFTGMAFVRYEWLVFRAIANHQLRRDIKHDEDRHEALQRVDELLEKIHDHPKGIRGLSFRERRFLKRTSKRFKKG